VANRANPRHRANPSAIAMSVSSRLWRTTSPLHLTDLRAKRQANANLTGGGVHLILKNEFYIGTFEWGNNPSPVLKHFSSIQKHSRSFKLFPPVTVCFAGFGRKGQIDPTLFSNRVVDAVRVTPTYRKPFDMIFKRARLEEWSGRLDSN
jgi:hypothetical protein